MDRSSRMLYCRFSFMNMPMPPLAVSVSLRVLNYNA